MARNYSNIALDTTLTAGIAAGDLSCVVASASGWPAAPFAAVIDPGGAAEEVVEVTLKVGTTFTITRGFDGTVAQAHLAAVVVRHAAIAGDFTDLQAADTTNAGAISTHVALTTGAHGGIVAGTDARLTDARAPTAHAATHASAGSDPVTLAQSQVTNLTTDLGAKAPSGATYITQTPDGGLGAEQALSALATGYVKNTTGTGVLSVQATPIPTADLGSGLADNTTFLRGDQTWAVPGGGSGTVGGTGTPGRVAQWAAGSVNIEDSTLAKTGAGLLTLDAAGAFTLTVPATGIAALLATANVFTQPQTINGANLGIAITGAASGGTPSIVASSPAQITTAVAGTPLQITASPAIAGSSVVGAAAGGAITITAGAAARLTSGNANGGDITLTPGAGIGTGAEGAVVLPMLLTSIAQVKFGGTGVNLASAANGSIALYVGSGVGTSFSTSAGATQPSDKRWGWGSTTTQFSNVIQDTALGRNAAAVVEVNTGTTGQWGALKAGTRDAGTTTITDGLTLGHQSTGTPAAGLGIGIQLNLNSSTTADQNAARISAIWTDATHATRTSALTFSTVDLAGSLTERMRIWGNGNVAIGQTAVTKNTFYAETPTLTDTTNTYTAAFGLAQVDAPSNSSIRVRAIMGQAKVSGSTALTYSNYVAGVDSDTFANNSNAAAVVGDLRGFNTNAYNNNANAVTSLYGLFSRYGTANTGGVTNAYGVFVQPFKSSTGAIATLYGLYVDPVAVGTANYAIFTNAGLVEHNDATTIRKIDAATATTTTVLTLGHNTSGTPAANYGTGLLFQGKSDTTVNRDMASISSTWATAADATRKARVIGTVYDTAAREWIRGEASGSAAMIGFLGAAAAIQQTGGAATATPVWTATEQGMLQKAYDALRLFGLLN